jgi:hypothetical protein
VDRDTFKTRSTSVWVMLSVVTMCCAIRTLLRRQQPGTARKAAPRPGRCQARLSALADQRLLKLGQGRKNMEHQLAPRGRGVNGFLQALKPDVPQMMHMHRLDQMQEGTAQPVELSYH